MVYKTPSYEDEIKILYKLGVEEYEINYLLSLKELEEK